MILIGSIIIIIGCFLCFAIYLHISNKNNSIPILTPIPLLVTIIFGIYLIKKQLPLNDK